jgi:hypothetical protein
MQLVLTQLDTDGQVTAGERAGDHSEGEVRRPVSHPGRPRPLPGPSEQGRRLVVLPPGGGLHGQRLVGHAGLGPEAQHVQQLDRLAGQGVRLDVVAEPVQPAGGQGQARGPARPRAPWLRADRIRRQPRSTTETPPTS